MFREVRKWQWKTKLRLFLMKEILYSLMCFNWEINNILQKCRIRKVQGKKEFKTKGSHTGTFTRLFINDIRARWQSVTWIDMYVCFFYEYKIKLFCCHDVQSPRSFHAWVQSTWQGVRKYPEYFDRNTELAVSPHNLEVIKRSECYVCRQLGTTGCEGSRFGLPLHFTRSLCGCLTCPFSGCSVDCLANVKSGSRSKSWCFHIFNIM